MVNLQHPLWVEPVITEQLFGPGGIRDDHASCFGEPSRVVAVAAFPFAATADLWEPGLTHVFDIPDREDVRKFDVLRVIGDEPNDVDPVVRQRTFEGVLNLVGPGPETTVLDVA